ncbi:MAG: FG-GAP-like repeat-containing protein [bacterium]
MRVFQTKWLADAAILSWLSLHAQTFTDASHLLIPNESISSIGASAVDFNNDGLVDIFHPSKLYLNRGPEGFKEMILTTGMIGGEAVFGAVFGDYDNDSYLDVFFEDLAAPGRLYRNRKTGSFEQTNLRTRLTPHRETQGSAWGDFNLDGKLDLFIGNDFGRNQLFQNLDYKSFNDVSLVAGVEAVGNTYGMSWGDYNNDGYPDAFLATCSNALENSIKHLLRNNGDGTFTNVNAAAGVNDSLMSWGIIWLDYDNDLDLDIYVANTEAAGRPGNDRLYRNNGNETFTDVAASAGVAGDADDYNFSAAVADFDNDGWVDIFVPVAPAPQKLYHNNGNGTFTEVSASTGIPEGGNEAVAVADFNRDGWIDIFNSTFPKNRLLLNNRGANHWIAIQTRGRSVNYYGVGARVTVHAGALRQMREIRAGEGFCEQSDNFTAHFGLGARTSVDSIVVHWPGGGRDKITNAGIDRYITVVQGLGLNNSPQTFNLLEPPDGHVLGNPTGPLRFAWQAAQNAEPDPLTYRLHFSGPELDTTFIGITSTNFSVEASFFQQYRVCKWTVDASDGFSITSSTEAFGFQAAACQPTMFFSLPPGNALPTDGTITRGSGWGDYDNDGDVDLFIANRTGNNFLFANDGSGTLSAVNEGAIVTDGGLSVAASWGDYDNDDDLDLFVTNFNENNFLYANQNGTWARVTAGAIATDVAAAAGCGWADYNNDGYLDLFVANTRNQNDFLYLNNRDGTFSKVVEGALVNDGGNSLGVAWADYDNDYDADLFVASAENDFFYTNNGDGTFAQVVAGDQVTDGAFSRGASWGDYDNDGDLDLFVTNDLNQNNRLYSNQGNGTFTSVTGDIVANDGGNSKGSCWGDFDNDGDLDLFVSNDGFSVIYINDGSGHFTRVTTDLSVLTGGASSCAADYDRDGDLDLLNVGNNGQTFLYANLGNNNRWCQIKCVGTISNRSAIGTKIRIKANINNRAVWQMREVSGQTGYLGQNSLNAAFGLADAQMIDTLRIEWPSRTVEQYTNVPTNHFIEATEGRGLTGVEEASHAVPEQFVLHQNYPNPFNPSTTIRFEMPHFGPVRLEIYDLQGARVRTLIAHEMKAAGIHTVTWDGKDALGKPVASGLYLYKLRAGSLLAVRKSLLIR